MDKRHLGYLITEEAGASEESEGEAQGNGAISYDTRSDASLASLVVSGCTDSGSDYITPVGIKTEDGYKIKVRIHGGRLIDGYELERIMVERGSPCYGGKVDDEHFLYIAKSDGEYTVFDRSDIFIPDATLTVEGEAVLYNAREDGKTATGMQVVSVSGRRAVAFLSTEAGETDFRLATGYIYGVKGIMHIPVEEEFSYAIRYDSFNIYINGEGSEEPYCGYTAEIMLDDALYSVNVRGNTVRDELDLISGRLVRRVCRVDLSLCEITEAYYGYEPCFMITLPVSASSECSVMSNKLYYSESYGFVDTPDSVTLGANNKQLYMNLGEDITTVAEAREYLGDNAWLVYPRESASEEYVSPIEDSTIAGKVCIEVCSPTAPEIYALYRK